MFSYLTATSYVPNEQKTAIDSVCIIKDTMMMTTTTMIMIMLMMIIIIIIIIIIIRRRRRRRRRRKENIYVNRRCNFRRQKCD